MNLFASDSIASLNAAVVDDVSCIASVSDIAAADVLCG